MLAPTREHQSVQTAPDFLLEDQTGQPVHLAELLGAGPIVLIFYRGHWCPYCRRYLAKIQEHLPQLTLPDARLLAISPEPATSSRALADQLQLTFSLLSDYSGHAIRSYGVRNAFLGHASILPHPAVFVLDGEGAIRFRSIDRNFKKRTTVRAILRALDTLRGDAHR